MKGFYIENFALRLIFCIIGMAAIWFGMQFLMSTFITHDPMQLRIIDVIVPLGCGIAQAFTWKPKE